MQSSPSAEAKGVEFTGSLVMINPMFLPNKQELLNEQELLLEDPIDEVGSVTDETDYDDLCELKQRLRDQQIKFAELVLRKVLSVCLIDESNVHEPPSNINTRAKDA